VSVACRLLDLYRYEVRLVRDSTARREPDSEVMRLAPVNHVREVICASVAGNVSSQHAPVKRERRHGPAGRNGQKHTSPRGKPRRSMESPDQINRPVAGRFPHLTPVAREMHAPGRLAVGFESPGAMESDHVHLFAAVVRIPCEGQGNMNE